MPLSSKLSAAHIAAARGQFEPQRGFSWKLEVAIENQGITDIILASLKQFGLPKISNEEIAIPFANSIRYVAGKITYEAQELTLVDYVDIGTANAIEQWAKEVRNTETESIGLSTDYKKECNIVLFAPNGTFERVWTLEGVWPQSTNYGDLNMEGSELVNVVVNLRYDKAIPAKGLNEALRAINLGEGGAPLTSVAAAVTGI